MENAIEITCVFQKVAKLLLVRDVWFYTKYAICEVISLQTYKLLCWWKATEAAKTINQNAKQPRPFTKMPNQREWPKLMHYLTDNLQHARS